MFRRFDAVVEYPLPSHGIIRKVICNQLATVRVGRLAWTKVDEAAAGLSHGEVTAAVDEDKPRHRELVDRIQAVRAASIEALWTDPPRSSPRAGQTICRRYGCVVGTGARSSVCVPSPEWIEELVGWLEPADSGTRRGDLLTQHCHLMAQRQ
jgi:hypothetical protein